MIIDDLVFNRTAADVQLVLTLAAKGRAGTWTAAEKTQFLTALKGAYNFEDINRVSIAQSYLAGLFTAYPATLSAYRTAAMAAILASLVFPASNYDLDDPLLPEALGQVDYTVPVLEAVKTDWDEEDDFTPATLGYYISNVKTLRDVLSTAGNVPDSLNELTFHGANEIEKMLSSVYSDLMGYEDDKENAIDEAEAESIGKYSLQGASWFLCGEVYTGEI